MAEADKGERRALMLRCQGEEEGLASDAAREAARPMGECGALKAGPDPIKRETPKRGV